MNSEGYPRSPECDCESASHPHRLRYILKRVHRLSDRELEVFGLLAEGASNRTISSRLRITERTAKAHVSQILVKMGLQSRTQVAIAAFAWKVRAGVGDGETAAIHAAMLST